MKKQQQSKSIKFIDFEEKLICLVQYLLNFLNLK